MLKLNLLTPEKKAVFDEEILEVTVPAHSGEMTILPGHAPLITMLGTGILKYKLKGKENQKPSQVVISWGYCEVVPGAVNVLAEFLRTAQDTSLEEAQAEVKTAELKLAQQSLSDEEFEATLAEADKGRATVQLLN